MALKDRLRSLRQQAGQSDSAPAAPPLADRLSRLRGGGTPAAPKTQRTSPEQLAERVGGDLVAPGLIAVEERFDLSHRHGEVSLSLLMEGGDLPEGGAIAAEEALFIDTETTGLSGGSGTAVFLLGMGRVVAGELQVRQFLMTSFAGEAAMFEQAAAWLRGTRTLVSFNGKSFDLPLLAARARLARTRDPFHGFGHVDLLHPTRRAFGGCWPDCRLGTAERELLRFRRIDDLPGAEAPEAWFAYLHRGDPSRLGGVLEHNRWDIVSLAALLPMMARVHRAPAAFGADPLAVARAALKAGDEPTAYRLLNECEGLMGEAGLLELARLHRGRGDWEKACAIWRRLAGQQCSEAIERLAKYFEHEAGDYRQALEYARRLPPSPERDHRCRRLEARLERGGDEGLLF